MNNTVASLAGFETVAASAEGSLEETSRRQPVNGPEASLRLLSFDATPFAQRQRNAGSAPIIFVDQAEPISEDSATNLLARTFRQSLISALCRFDGIVVARTPLGAATAIEKMLDADQQRPAYRFASEVRIAGDTLHLWWHLSDMRTMETYRSAVEDGPALLEGGTTEQFAAALVAVDVLHTIADRQGNLCLRPSVAGAAD